MRRSVVALLFVLGTPAFLASQTDTVQATTSPVTTSQVPTVQVSTVQVSAVQAPRTPNLAQRSWGLGLSLSAIGSADGLPVSIRIPFGIGRRWRLEPELGFYRSTSKNSTYTNNPSSPTPPVHDEGPHLHDLNLAFAIARIIPIDSTVRFYVGPRIGWVRQTTIFDVDGSAGIEHLDISTTDRWLGVLTGAEASFGSRLTLGGEVGLAFVSGGEAHVHLPPFTYVQIQDGGHWFTTTGAIVMRWFPGRIATGAGAGAAY